MNNELFDKILKSELDKVTVAPSAGLKKAVGAKLFMQNVVIFHKVKAIAALFVIGSAATAGFMFSDESSYDSGLSQTNEIFAPTEDLDADDQLISIASLENQNIDPVISFDPSNPHNPEDDKLVDEVILKDNKGDFEVAVRKNSKEKGIEDNTSSTGGAIKNNINHSSDKGKPVMQIPVAPISNKSMAVINGQNDEPLVTDYDAEPEVHNIERMIVATKAIDFNILALDKLEAVDLPEIGEMSRVIVKEVSFDIYGLGKGISDVDNSISSAVYRQYHWDFYKESDGLAMEKGAGGQVNFTIGTPLLKFKTAIGVNTSKFIDTKAKYTHGEIKDPDWLNYFGTDELSWVNTYGEDSCEVCMYASNTDDFKSEMREDYNRYSYINIPIKAGLEFDLKRFSVSAFGGVQLSQLISAKGLGIAKREFSENERFYYWNDIKVVALQEDNQLMKSRFLSYQAGVDVRIRILPKFDLLAGYELNTSVGKITQSDNVVQKSLSYQQAKVGVTFHPSRSAIQPKF
jgi:hypothetical protein